MEAVTANLVFFIDGIGQRIHIRLRGHGTMEGGVDDEYLRNILHNLHTAPDARKVSERMKRGDIHAFFKVGNHAVGDKHGFGEPRTAVHDAVTYGVYFAHIPERAVFI